MHILLAKLAGGVSKKSKSERIWRDANESEIALFRKNLPFQLESRNTVSPFCWLTIKLLI
jgi:hypothetical protein